MYVNTTSFLATYKNDERGVTAIEYGLIGVAMATLLAAVFTTNGTLLTALKSAFSTIETALSVTVK